MKNKYLHVAFGINDTNGKQFLADYGIELDKKMSIKELKSLIADSARTEHPNLIGNVCILSMTEISKDLYDMLYK